MIDDITPELEQKMRILANFMIDKVLAMEKKNLTPTNKDLNLELDQNNKYGTHTN
ncbi:MAG: hypothetical protein V1858_02060 [Candidatus Gottesmanbacteria bacterium]